MKLQIFFCLFLNLCYLVGYFMLYLATMAWQWLWPYIRSWYWGNSCGVLCKSRKWYTHFKTYWWNKRFQGGKYAPRFIYFPFGTEGWHLAEFRTLASQVYHWPSSTCLFIAQFLKIVPWWQGWRLMVCPKLLRRWAPILFLQGGR